jgi:proline dehydrogenase
MLKYQIAASRELGYNLGIKLIRGAYMEEEKELASKHNYESPIWETIEQTHECYDSNLMNLINASNEKDVVFVASHN